MRAALNRTDNSFVIRDVFIRHSPSLYLPGCFMTRSILFNSLHVIVRDAAHGLAHAPAVSVVGEGQRRGAVRHARQLPGVLPRVAPRTVACQVADLVAGQRLPVVSGEQIANLAFSVKPKESFFCPLCGPTQINKFIQQILQGIAFRGKSHTIIFFAAFSIKEFPSKVVFSYAKTFPYWIIKHDEAAINIILF